MEKPDKKIFGVLFFSIFATITGVGIVVPLLPVYAKNLGAGGLYIGLIFGAFSISRTFFLPFFGRLSDKKGRKPYIVIGLFGYAVISVMFIFAPDVESLIFIRFLQGIASAMIMPVVHAYVGDLTSENREGITMGVFNMSLFLGLSAGPLAGGVIQEMFNLRAAFICMGILSLAGFLLSLALLPPVKSERALQRKTVPTDWKRILADREIWGLFLFRFAFTVCIAIIWGFLPVFADAEFSLSGFHIGLLITLGVFISGVVQTPMGYLADILDKRLMILAGGTIIAASVFAFNYASGFRDLFLMNLLFGIGGGIATAPHTAMSVRKGNDANAMGSVMSVMTVAHSAGMMTGAIFAGLVMDFFRIRLAFPAGAVVMAFGIAALAVLGRQKNTVKP